MSELIRVGPLGIPLTQELVDDAQFLNSAFLEAPERAMEMQSETNEERKARLEEIERVKREKAHINMHEFSVARRMSERECLEQLVSLGPPTDADGGWNECCDRMSEYSDTLTEKEHLFLNHNVDCPYLQAWLMLGMENE